MPTISGDTYSSAQVPAYMLSGDGLIIVGTPTMTPITLVPGMLLRGAVLGQITATGMYALCDASQADGRQTPVAILARPPNPGAGIGPAAYPPGQATTYDLNYILHHSSWSDAAMIAALQTAGFALVTRGFSYI